MRDAHNRTSVIGAIPAIDSVTPSPRNFRSEKMSDVDHRPIDHTPIDPGPIEA